MESPNRSSRGLWTRVRNGSLTTTFTVLATLSIGVLAGSMLTGKVSAKQVNSSDAQPLSIPNPVTLSNGFSAIVKQVGPAVVNINVETLPKQPTSARNHRAMPQDPNGDDDQGQGQGQGDQGMQDFFNRFFGGQGGPGGQGGQEAGPRRALGSGFIVDPRGYIITNNHVVDGADHIYVKLSSDPDDPSSQGRPATLIGTDKDTDIAVIKIDSKEPLPTVKMGNSDSIQVGDWVLAIGTPFGERNTVSAGIISAKDRTIDEGGDANGVAVNEFQKFIQTDAAINPGNSGGPLVNMAAQVIGMNTAIFTQSAGSEGIGFAMPSNTIINVYNQLIGPEHKVVRGSIGVQFQAAESSAVGRVYGFANGGVIVSEVVPNGPAAKAGVQPKDIIVSVDGNPIKNGDQLIQIVSAKRPGSTVKLGIIRGGQHLTLDVGVTDRTKLYANMNGGSDQSNSSNPSDVGQNMLGITVQPTSQATASHIHINGGVTVTSVKPGSFADNIGLGQGAVITEINRRPITDEASYRSVVTSLKPGDDVVFVVRDPRNPNGGDSYVGGTLPQ
ncbi:MAG: PDZ domain-containing protein [Acidobacteria bacterium]|nr:PDZ domain-containing protein [Acidobacteriota bacterium]